MSEAHICNENGHAQIYTALIQIKHLNQSSANSENLWVDQTLCKQPLNIFGLIYFSPILGMKSQLSQSVYLVMTKGNQEQSPGERAIP